MAPSHQTMLMWSGKSPVQISRTDGTIEDDLVYTCNQWDPKPARQPPCSVSIWRDPSGSMEESPDASHQELLDSFILTCLKENTLLSILLVSQARWLNNQYRTDHHSILSVVICILKGLMWETLLLNHWSIDPSWNMELGTEILAACWDFTQ